MVLAPVPVPVRVPGADGSGSGTAPDGASAGNLGPGVGQRKGEGVERSLRRAESARCGIVTVCYRQHTADQAACRRGPDTARQDRSGDNGPSPLSTAGYRERESL